MGGAFRGLDLSSGWGFAAGGLCWEGYEERRCIRILKG